MIAAHFIHRPIKWIGVDGATEMVALFSQNTLLYGASIQVTTRIANFAKPSLLELAEDTSRGHWVVLISFVLTSLSKDEIIASLARGLPNVQAIIVADSHPLYTAKRPNYDFVLGDGAEVVLTPRPVYPDVLEELLLNAGFSLRKRQLVRRPDNDDPYAFVNVFIRTRNAGFGPVGREGVSPW